MKELNLIQLYTNRGDKYATTDPLEAIAVYLDRYCHMTLEQYARMMGEVDDIDEEIGLSDEEKEECYLDILEDIRQGSFGWSVEFQTIKD